jgi:hypothetical protein
VQDGSIPLKQEATLTGPLGDSITFTCRGHMDFKHLDDGSTEIVAIHEHKLTGGTWFIRRQKKKSNQESEVREFGERIDRCQAALRPLPIVDED